MQNQSSIVVSPRSRHPEDVLVLARRPNCLQRDLRAVDDVARDAALLHVGGREDLRVCHLGQDLGRLRYGGVRRGAARYGGASGVVIGENERVVGR